MGDTMLQVALSLIRQGLGMLKTHKEQVVAKVAYHRGEIEKHTKAAKGIGSEVRALFEDFLGED